MEKQTYTPMIEQYLEVKQANPDSILFYRIGDFYEMFFEDARVASLELDLVLTGKQAGGGKKIDMCGIPHHAADGYIQRLVKKGYKVSICEQLSDPKAKGIVERGIVQTITPGTYLSDTSKNSMRLAVLNDGALIYYEISTGKLSYRHVGRVYALIKPYLQEVNELVIPYGLPYENQIDFPVVSKQKKQSVQVEIDLPETIVPAYELLVAYIQTTQQQAMPKVASVVCLDDEQVLRMDQATIDHLAINDLWENLDHCGSVMGSRLLKQWLLRPLLDVNQIAARQQEVAHWLQDFVARDELTQAFKQIYDLERLTTRLAYQKSSGKDLIQIKQTLEVVKTIQAIYPIEGCDSVYNLIDQALVDEPPISLKEGGLIKEGYSSELDQLRKLAQGGQQFILDFEAGEREKTGIKSLKVGYHRVFGYYIEIRHGNEVLPEWGYEPKQTLANATRYASEILKEKERQILSSQESALALEGQLFNDLIEQLQAYLPDLYRLAEQLAHLDVVVTLANLAYERQYVCPVFHESREIEVKEASHPILSIRLKQYVRNDWQQRVPIQLITGPNMGGKSTYMRMNALLVILAQMGSFVPAKSASLPLFDRIFTRIGASDDILSGHSTFMVEMMEANQALKYASAHSLILMDEIGRGTATYDGMALAQAMLEYIESAIGATTLFSTHYHELTELANQHEAIQNVHVMVQDKKEALTFLYRVQPGIADKSYGIHVAKLAGLPEVLLERANQLLAGFEKKHESLDYQPSLFVMDRPQPKHQAILDELDQLEVDNLSPKEAWLLLERWVKEKHQS